LTKNGWNCVNKNYIKLDLKLNASFASFTTANYIQIEQEICEIIGKEPKHFNIE